MVKAPPPVVSAKLLNATQAAALLGVNRATFRRWNPPAVVLNERRWFTEPALAQWLRSRETSCATPVPPAVNPKPSPAKNTSSAAKGRMTGTSTSPSNVVAFAEAAGLRTRP